MVCKISYYKHKTKSAMEGTAVANEQIVPPGNLASRLAFSEAPAQFAGSFLIRAYNCEH